MPPPNLNPAEKKKGLRCTQTPPPCTPQQGCLLERHSRQGLPVTWVCVCTQGKNILGKIAFTVGLDLTQNRRARHTLSFDRSWHNLLGAQIDELVLPLHLRNHCFLSCTLPSLSILPSLAFPHNYFPRHLRFPKWRGWPKNPVSEHLHKRCWGE